jgi:hypothetical protein
MFEDYAVRQIGLKRCENEEGALILWKLALARPGANVLQRRGEYLLGRFQGVSFHNVDGSSVSSAVKQSQLVDSAAVLEEFELQAESMCTKFARQLNKTHECEAVVGPKIAASSIDAPMTEDGMRQSSGLMHGMVLKELQRKAEQDAVEEERLQNLAEEARRELMSKQVKTLKIEKDKESNRLQSVEKLTLSSNINKSSLSLASALTSKVQALAANKSFLEEVLADYSSLVTSEVSAEKDKLYTEVDDALKQVKKEHDKEIAEWVEFSAAEHTADEYYEFGQQVSKDCKSLLVSECFKNVVKKITAVSNYKNQTLKAFLLKTKQDAKSSASRAEINSNIAVTSPLALALQAHLESANIGILGNQNLLWDVIADLMEANVGSPVLIPSERLANMATEIAAMDYFVSQKAWVSELMKGQNLQTGTAAIVKAPVLRRVKKFIEGSIISCLKARDPTGTASLDDIFAPQFFQHRVKGSDVLASTHFGLIDVRLTLVGSEVIFGVKHDCLTGDTLKEKQKTLTQMSAGPLLQLVAAHGFCYVSKPGTAIAIPCGYALVVLNNDKKDTHGLRWQLVGSEKRRADSVAILSKLVQSWPAFEKGLHSTLLKFLAPVPEPVSQPPHNEGVDL